MLTILCASLGLGFFPRKNPLGTIDLNKIDKYERKSWWNGAETVWVDSRRISAVFFRDLRDALDNNRQWALGHWS